MAIFNMENSSINEYINENRSHKQMTHVINKYTNEKPGKMAYKSHKDDLKWAGEIAAKNLDDDALKASIKSFKSVRNDLDNDESLSPAKSYLAKKSTKKDYGIIYGAELKRRGYDPRLREAAEYILSILDEMDYLD